MSISSPTNAKRCGGLIRLLAVVLLFSASAPCSLIEVASERICTEPRSAVEHGAANVPRPCETGYATESEDAAGLQHVDCCSTCVTCCPTYAEGEESGSPISVGVAPRDVFSFTGAPLGPSLSIWNPPRV